MGKVHFISGLPRSGSTLLAGILRQNPRCHAAMSSPVGGLIHGALEHMGSGSEGAAFFDTDRRRAAPSWFRWPHPTIRSKASTRSSIRAAARSATT